MSNDTAIGGAFGGRDRSGRISARGGLGDRFAGAIQHRLARVERRCGARNGGAAAVDSGKFVFEVCGEVPEHHRFSGCGCARVAGSSCGTAMFARCFCRAIAGHAGYKEFEVAPNGFWIDLDIAPGEKRDLRSGLRRRVDIDEERKSWRAVLDLPMKSLTARFDVARDVAGEFLSSGGRRGAAVLFGLAADADAPAEFSCARGVWEAGFSTEVASRWWLATDVCFFLMLAGGCVAVDLLASCSWLISLRRFAFLWRARRRRLRNCYRQFSGGHES